MLPALAIPALVKGGYDVFRMIQSQKNLDALSQTPTPRFSDNTSYLGENKRMYQQQYNQGMSPATRALATQNFAASQAAGQRSASETSGGQMSNALSRMGAAGNANFALNLAAQNEAVQNQARSGIASTNLQLQSRKDKDIQNQYSELQNMKQQYGAAFSEAAMGGINAIGGYFMGQMNLEEAEKDRQLYRDMNGIGGDNASLDEGSNTNTGILGNINSPSNTYLGGKSYMYKDLRGNKRMGFLNNIDKNTLPPSMGGTNLSLEGRYKNMKGLSSLLTP
jgi:hypothetical protein